MCTSCRTVTEISWDLDYVKNFWFVCKGYWNICMHICNFFMKMKQIQLARSPHWLIDAWSYLTLHWVSQAKPSINLIFNIIMAKVKSSIWVRPVPPVSHRSLKSLELKEVRNKFFKLIIKSKSNSSVLFSTQHSSIFITSYTYI